MFMKRILISLSIIGLVSAVAFGATRAYFSDTETSSGNTFTAGAIDLKIDYQCGENCYYPLQDLDDGNSFFNYCDIKPGDNGEVTISWHINSNKAWARIRLDKIRDKEYGCTEPEREYPDTTCDTDGVGLGMGELSQYLAFTAWMDEGDIAGWQCTGKGGCAADPKEGDNIFNGRYDKYIFENKSAQDLVAGVPLPGELDPNNTYYVGFQWDLPFSTPNIVQTDSIVASIVMEVVQSRNNPNPWN